MQNNDTNELGVLAENHCVMIYNVFSELEASKIHPSIHRTWVVGQRIARRRKQEELEEKNTISKLETFYDDLETNYTNMAELEYFEELRKDIDSYGLKVRYSVQDNRNQLVHPSVRAYIGKKTVSLSDHSIELTSPTYAEIAKWVDSMLGELSTYYIFSAVTHNGDVALVELKMTMERASKLKEDKKKWWWSRS